MMNKHVNIVAYLHIGYGLLMLLSAALLFIAVAGGGWVSGDTGAMVLTTTMATGIGLFLGLLALLSLIGGIGLLQKKPWARTLLVILSFINLFSFPFGTLLGAYSLWILMRAGIRDKFTALKS